jgi:hypothetical protein
MVLTQQQIDDFHRDGFVGPFTAFSAVEAERFRQIVCELVLTTPSPYSPYRTELRHLDSATIWSLCTSPAITGCLHSLYGPDLMVWYSNLFDKGSDRIELQGTYPWHQDTIPFEDEDQTTLTVWLALTPATAENGCVELLAGTHQQTLPILQETATGIASWFGGRVSDTSSLNPSGGTQMVLDAGQFFLFDGRVVHASGSNRTAHRRIGLSFRVTVPSKPLGVPHPCLLLGGDVGPVQNVMGVPPTRDPSLVLGAQWLRDAGTFRFDQAMPGLGWHLPEYIGQHPFRWTGPEAESWLEFARPEPGCTNVRCSILHAVAAPTLESLQILVNDVPLDIVWSELDSGVQVRADIPQSVLDRSVDRLRLTFRVAQVHRPCDLVATSTDNRSLGVAIADLAFE